MTITLQPQQANLSGTAEPVRLDGGLFFQPLPVVEQARQLARDGVGIVVTLPLDGLNDPRLTGATRQLLEVSVESRLRSALTGAGYRTISRRCDVQDALVLDAATHVTGTAEAIWLDGGLFFQPLPVTERARQLARDGAGIVVTLPLHRLNDPRLTGVTRQMLEASVESRLRSALTAAGYHAISRRREIHEAMVLDATA